MVVVKRILVSGVVQGVGYRFFAERVARAAGIRGFVRNLPDGRVEVVAEASTEADVDALVDALRQGPRSSLVRAVKVEGYPKSESFDGFGIRY